MIAKGVTAKVAVTLMELVETGIYNKINKFSHFKIPNIYNLNNNKKLCKFSWKSFLTLKLNNINNCKGNYILDSLTGGITNSVMKSSDTTSSTKVGSW